MKFMLCWLLLCNACKVFSQEKNFTLTAKDYALNVSTDSSDDNVTLLLNADKFVYSDVIKIDCINPAKDSGWKRSFFIYDSSGNSIENFKVLQNNTYYLKLSQLRILLQSGVEYFIYTSAIPVDAQQAMLVKPGKKLICKLKIL